MALGTCRPSFPWRAVSLLRRKHRNIILGQQILACAELAQSLAAAEEVPCFMLLRSYFELAAYETWFLRCAKEHHIRRNDYRKGSHSSLLIESS